MTFDKFTIKYLPEIFPSLDFEQTFTENFRVIASDNLIENEKTSERWFSVIDNDAISRNIQTSINTRYTCEFLSSENIDFGVLKSAGDVTAITDVGLMTLFDIEVEKELIEGTRTYKITLSFTDKGTGNIASFLDTENVETLGGGNFLTYEVTEPAYTYRVNVANDGSFTIPNSGAISNIAINDYLYAHSNEINISSTDIDLEVVKCVAKDATILTFNPINVGVRTIQTNVHIQLDYNPERDTYGLVVARKLTVNLYTLLQPKINLIEPIFSDEINLQSGIKKFTNAVTGNLLNCNFYVKESDLWKIKYLNYADSCMFTKGSTIYYADYTAEIITLTERKSLLGLYESELNLPYNTLSSNIY